MFNVPLMGRNFKSFSKILVIFYFLFFRSQLKTIKVNKEPCTPRPITWQETQNIFSGTTTWVPTVKLMLMDRVGRDLSINTETDIILTKGTTPKTEATMKRKTYTAENLKLRTDNSNDINKQGVGEQRISKPTHRYTHQEDRTKTDSARRPEAPKQEAIRRTRKT